MPKVIAKAEIHRTIKPGKAATATSPAVKPEIEIIKPGTAFIAEGEELKALRASRAVRDPEVAEAPVPSATAEDDDAPATKPGSKPKTSTKTASKPKNSKPKTEPAASTDKTSTEGADAGNGGENDSDDDNGAGDGNEGDDDANLV